MALYRQLPMRGRAARDISLDVVTVPTWRELRRRLPQLLVGIPVLGVGIAMTLQARLGVSPYDVLHQGIAAKTGLSVGTVVILVGLVILVFWIPLRQRPGLGTMVNTLTVGLVIDLALRVVPKPDLLAAFLKAPGRVFERSQLLDTVWGSDVVVGDRTVDVHVKALRRKLEEAGGDPKLLETVRGVGYRLRDAP